MFITSCKVIVYFMPMMTACRDCRCDLLPENHQKTSEISWTWSSRPKIFWHQSFCACCKKCRSRSFEVCLQIDNWCSYVCELSFLYISTLIKFWIRTWCLSNSQIGCKIWLKQRWRTSVNEVNLVQFLNIYVVKLYIETLHFRARVIFSLNELSDKTEMVDSVMQVECRCYNGSKY